MFSLNFFRKKNKEEEEEKSKKFKTPNAEELWNSFCIDETEVDKIRNRGVRICPTDLGDENYFNIFLLYNYLKDLGFISWGMNSDDVIFHIFRIKRSRGIRDVSFEICMEDIKIVTITYDFDSGYSVKSLDDEYIPYIIYFYDFIMFYYHREKELKKLENRKIIEKGIKNITCKKD
jgi:hypothetical protein